MSRTPTRGVALAGLVLLLLAACTPAPVARAREAKRQYDELARAILGHYASREDEDLRLTIVAVPAQMIGRDVLVVREALASDPHRVLLEQIWTLDLDAKQQIVQHVFLIKDPARWRHWQESPELLQSLLPEDLSALTGCELRWRQTPTGYEAEPTSTPCRPGDAAGGHLVLRAVSVRDRALELSQTTVDTNGVPDEAAVSHHWFARAGEPAAIRPGATVRDPKSR